MKSFSDTPGAQVDASQYDVQTNWLKAAEAVGHTLNVMSANISDTQFGSKAFLHVIVDGDEEAVEYTISFSALSAVYAQISAMLEDKKSDSFPFQCSIAQLGRTFQLVDPVTAKKPPKLPAKPAKAEGAPW